MSAIKNILSCGYRLSNVVFGARNFSLMCRTKSFLPITSLLSSNKSNIKPFEPSILSSATAILPSLALNTPSLQQTRSVTKWSLKKGKRKSSHAVPARFFRLHWGAWIRPIVGRNKRHWSKDRKRKIRAEKHVFCNATQSTLLDKMVTKFWRKRRYYIDDIYEPYHEREEFPMSATKPH